MCCSTEAPAACDALSRRLLVAAGRPPSTSSWVARGNQCEGLEDQTNSGPRLWRPPTEGGRRQSVPARRPLIDQATLTPTTADSHRRSHVAQLAEPVPTGSWVCPSTFRALPACSLTDPLDSRPVVSAPAVISGRPTSPPRSLLPRRAFIIFQIFCHMWTCPGRCDRGARRRRAGPGLVRPVADLRPWCHWHATSSYYHVDVHAIWRDTAHQHI